MSLSNDEIIKRLRQAGVEATSCHCCGRVKEVQDGRIVFHYVNATEIICEGSNTEVLGDISQRLAEIEKIEFSEVHGPQNSDDYLALAGESAKEHMESLFEALEQASAVALENLPEDAVVILTVKGNSGDFCGCTTCIVREVMTVVWPFAVQAEASDIVNYLQRESSREGLPKPIRKACQHIADQIAEHHYDGYKDA